MNTTHQRSFNRRLANPLPTIPIADTQPTILPLPFGRGEGRGEGANEQLPIANYQLRIPPRIRALQRCIAALVLFLSAALPLFAQPRTGGGGGGGGGGFGGGGFGGGGLNAIGGGNRGASANVTSRTYPANGTIPDAYFSIDPETRRVVVIAPQEAMDKVMEVLTNLDRPKPQVLINVVFIEVTHNDASDIGIEGGWTKGIFESTTGNVAHVFGLSGLNQAAGTNLNNVFGQPISAFQSTASPVAGGNAGLYQILGANYQATLRLIASAGKAKVLSRPSILARNNQPAQIVVGQQVPLVTSVSYSGLNGTPINAVTYENVGVILNVTPFITSDGLVEMIINPQVSSLDTTTTVPISLGVNAPVIDTRSANTVAVTPDGQTVCLGGMMQTTKASTVTKIPVLGDIPGLGYLFRRTIKSDTQTELIIFLTPHIIQSPTQLASLEEKQKARASVPKALTEEELNKYLDGLPSAPPPQPGAAPMPKKH
jgi:type II secretion system protein D